MKMKWMILPALVVAASACSQANFGSQGSKKADGAVDPAGGQQNPENAPLDISSQGGNRVKAAAGAPTPGNGQVADKSIDLTCDNSSGIIIDVGSPDGGTTGGGTTGGGTTGGPGDGSYDGGKGVKLRLLGSDPASDPTVPTGKDGTTTYDTGKGGKPVDLDKDGKPVGGKDDGSGKGDEPLPPAPPVDVPVTAKVTARVKGQFCPKAQNKLSVLFVVDYSGSMGNHVELKGTPPVPGNDPQINGSCGRLRAAQAIISKIRATRQPNDSVQIAMVPFAGGILNNKVMQFADVEAFAAAVSKDTFCQYVIQDPSFGIDPINPGGIDGRPYGVDASTNYKAAFTAAQSLLTGVYGRKVVYFISDGEPTSTGSGQPADQDPAFPIQAGIDAGAALRNSVDNLTVNGLLLGNLGPQAAAVLVSVTGSPDRVRTADNADQLADQILLFPEASIDPSTGRATLTVDPYPRADLGLKYLTQDPTHPDIWVYETQPFVLLGQPGVAVLNVVEVTARGTDGSTYSAVVKINYKQ